MVERNITAPEIEYVLLNGDREKSKDCCVEDDVVVVTVIDLTASPDKQKKAR